MFIIIIFLITIIGTSCATQNNFSTYNKKRGLMLLPSTQHSINKKINSKYNKKTKKQTYKKFKKYNKR